MSTTTQPVSPTPTPEQLVATLGTALDSPGWTQIIRPAALAVCHIYNVGLINGDFKDNENRPVSDAECRAVIKTFQWLLNWENRRDAASKELALAAANPPSPEIPGGSPLVEQPE